MFKYVGRLVHQFGDEHFGQLAASLAFTTLLSIVPLVTLALIVASASPLFGALVSNLDGFLVDNLLPGKTGGVVARYTLQFSEKASRLTVAGVVVLVLTSFLLLSSIERAFNHLWKVRKPRPIFQRIRFYAVLLVVGPLAAGAVMTALSYAVTSSIGLLGEGASVRYFVLKVLAAALLCTFFAFLYYALPNARVRPLHAFIGGGIATAGIMASQRLFEYYLSNFGTYTKIYGAFAALPIFLVWLYLCWVIVLVGAVVVANFRPGSSRAGASG